MRFNLLSIALVLAWSALVSTVNLEPAPRGSPELSRIYSFFIPTVYGCSAVSYATSALYTGRTDPDLLFNGACGALVPYWDISLAGDEIGLIAYATHCPFVDEALKPFVTLVFFSEIWAMFR